MPYYPIYKRNLGWHLENDNATCPRIRLTEVPEFTYYQIINTELYDILLASTLYTVTNLGDLLVISEAGLNFFYDTLEQLYG